MDNNSNTNNDDEYFFNEGEWVESRLNTDVFGIVVGEADFGRSYFVQLASSLKIEAFKAVTLRRMEDDGLPPNDDEIDDDNVIDFTKYRDLNADTRVKGAA